ncbi:protein kinase [Pelagicoccus sp. NFK12]|uniref:Protein kinase n=1 Tax=Pelagicoccus enzymogenes TaxID=2773457 RepID=A0A927IHK2_9BACT|nr:protein kinase [Pelagicoccus enzymogenes]MBD5779788.1 protein kinase [Pelagicoccus enzymogenes]
MNDIFGRNQELMELPRRLGNYELTKLLGQGGMGEVYLAHNVELKEPAAVKLLPKHLAHDSSFVNRFREEARKLRRLQHQNIVQAHDFGRDGNDFYLVMECIDGGDLQDVIDANPNGLPPDEAQRYLLEIAAAVKEAHKTTIHRDLSPNNILLTKDGKVKVSDFGLSEVVGEDYARSLIQKSVTLSQVGIAETLPAENSRRAANIVGKVRYMSPQVTRGEPSDKRNDIYAIGIMLYDMLTGRTTGMVRSLRKEKPELDPRWQSIFDRCTADEISSRYQNIAELENDIREISANPKRKTPMRTLLSLLCLSAIATAAYYTSESWLPIAQPYIDSAREKFADHAQNPEVASEPPEPRKGSTAASDAAEADGTNLPNSLVRVSLETSIPSDSKLVLLSPRPQGIQLEYAHPSEIQLPSSSSDYTMRFEHPKYLPVTFTIPGNAGQHPVRFKTTQVRESHEFTIYSNPSGATVFLEDQAIGKTPLNRTFDFVRSHESQPFGRLNLRLELPGHETTEFSLEETSPSQLPVIQIPAQRAPRKLQIPLANGNQLEVTYIEPGIATIGSPDTEIGRIAHAESLKQIEVDQAFYISVTEVTQAQYRAIMNSNPSFYLGDNRPVEQVVYRDIKGPEGFLQKLNDHLQAHGYNGWTADLPTNVEWEYAARAGSQSTYYNGNDITQRGRDPNLDPLAVYMTVATANVASKTPNEWGLYDVLGNVFEWTSEGDLRGGSFKQQATTTRPAYRLIGKSDRTKTDKDANQFGLRIVLRPPN